MDIKKVKITKKDLKALPDKERIFLLHILNIANDINCLQKIAIYSIRGLVENGPNKNLTNEAQNIQSISIFILLAGKLFEAYEVLRKDFMGNSLSKIYYPKIQPQGKACFDSLKKNIGGNSLFYEIRNKFSFHYDTESLDIQFNEYNENKEFDLYFSEVYGNNIYTTSSILFHRILKLTNPSFDINADFENDADAKKVLMDVFKIFFDLILNTAKDFQTFISECLIVFAGEHSWELEKVIPPEFTKIENIKIPFFIEK